MTLDDLLAREAIRDTIAKYNVSGDRLKAEDYASCFTDDAVIESEHVSPEQTFRYAGRAAIFAWQDNWRAQARSGKAVHKATFVRHHLSTSKIDLTGPDTAKVRTYWVAWTDIGADHAGYYLDNFRKVGDDWLIAHRRIRLDWQSPDGLMMSSVENSKPAG
jgi:hypothetical protein